MESPLPADGAAEARRLFVYGSLRAAGGHPLARELARHSRPLGPARLRGRLYHLGAYPGAVADDAAPGWVHGELCELNAATAGLLWRRLDAYEGPSFPRRRVVVRLPDETSLSAHAYLLAASAGSAPCLEHGDWLRETRQQRGDAGETDGAGDLARPVELA